MKIIVLSTEKNIYASLLLKELIKNKEHQIVGIVESSVYIKNHSFLYGLLKYLKTAGLYYISYQWLKYLIIYCVVSIIALFKIKVSPESIYVHYKTLIKNTPIFQTKNIDDPKIINQIEKLNPDVLISIFFIQKISEALLKVPKKGAFNIHLGKLPKYRGLLPVFWALSNNEKEVGVTIHRISPDLDDGNILVQKSIYIEPEDSEHSIEYKLIKMIIPDLREFLRSIEDGTCQGKAQKESEASYYSIATKEAMNNFKKNNKKFFRFRDFFEYK